MARDWDAVLERIDACRWRIPTTFKPGMRVEGVIYANDDLIDLLRDDESPEQVANVAFLPGIVKHSLALPDIHWGYGFCIGATAATDVDAGGVVSPGGVGYDINCGVRLLSTPLASEEVSPRIETLMNELFADIPCGVGRGGRITFSRNELEGILKDGARFAVKAGYGVDEDVERCEAAGRLENAEPRNVSQRAYNRGRDQCGTLGAGNHFIEVQVVEEVFDEEAAHTMGLEKGRVTVMIHTGSRGLGHQVCDDYLKELSGAPAKYGISIPDRQLVCAPVNSPPGKRYLGAMRGAANFAWANRQILSHLVRGTFQRVFKGLGPGGLRLLYDVAHNVAKIEEHLVGGRKRLLCVHRKGATRAFPAGHPEVPGEYRDVGQPVLIPGDMGRASYVLVGTETAMRDTFGTTCHGAGRVMSRHHAVKMSEGRSIEKELAERGIVARSRSRTGLAEEQSAAYKDVAAVVAAVCDAGLSRKIARLRPLGVIKG